jgi:hypothetical protein
MTTMKKAIFVIVALLAFAVSTVDAQVLVVRKNIVTGKQFRISQNDSTATVNLCAVANTPYPLITGQFPDSARVKWYSTSDSLTSIFIYLKEGISGSGIYNTETVLDSVKAATAVASQGSHLLTRSQYVGYDALKLALRAQATGNAYVLANASKTTVWIELYYTMLGRP